MLNNASVTKCRTYKQLVLKEVEAVHYESAASHCDSLLYHSQLEKWYRMLHAHVDTVQQLVQNKGRGKDVPPVAYPHLLTVAYASTLVGGSLNELADLVNLIVKLFAKHIDSYMQEEKGFTEAVARNRYTRSGLRSVDEDIVRTFPGGNNWKVSPEERLDLVLGMCESKRVAVKDKDRLRMVILGSVAVQRASTSYTSYTSYTTQSTQSTEYEHASYGAYGTPTSKLASEGKGTPKEGERSSEKKKSRRKKKSRSGSGGSGEETWRMVSQLSPGNSGSTHGVGGRQSERSGGGEQTPGVSQQETPASEPEPGYGMQKPGYSPPQQKFDGESLSFGRKLDNCADFMQRRATDDY